MRSGVGFDAHRFGGQGPLLLAGAVVDEERGVESTSDGDVVAHAVADALLGSMALGDMGDHFPSSAEASVGMDSMDALRQIVKMLSEAGTRPHNVDVTVVAQSVRISPHRLAMRTQLATVLGLGLDAVSVKATTTDHMGAVGRDEGIAVIALVTVDQP